MVSGIIQHTSPLSQFPTAENRDNCHTQYNSTPSLASLSTMKISSPTRLILASSLASNHRAITAATASASEGNLRANRALSLDATEINVAEILNLYEQGALTEDQIKSKLNAICQAYSQEDCWSDALFHDRMLVEEGSFDSQALLDEFPDNRDTIAYSQEDLMNWLNDGVWSSLTQDSLNVRYVKLMGTGTKGALVMSPGQKEPTAKYAETLRTFVDAGYSPVFSIDHVSQGTSDRPLDDHFKQHIEDGAHFISAFKTFLDVVLNEIPNQQPRFLACHSMGCAIAFTLLIEDYEAQHPTRFNAVVANAPLIKADTSPFPYPIATAIGGLMVGLGLGENYAPTQQKTFAESYGNQNFEGSSTSSLVRWLRTRDLCLAAKDQEVGDDNHIGLCLGGISANFAQELFRLYNALDDFNDGKGKISTPVLIQMAGDATDTDGNVQNPETANFCSEALKHCTLENFAASRHNIWWEADEIRDPALLNADIFFQRHKESKVPQCPPEPTCGRWKYSRARCHDSSVCSHQFKVGDWHLGASCRPRSDVC